MFKITIRIVLDQQLRIALKKETKTFTIRGEN